jgi:malate dehydrogenase (NADP+)
MGVIVNKDVYGLELGICFSLPCICSGLGEFKIIDNIELNEYQKVRIQEGCQELIKEREIVKNYINEESPKN